MGEGSQAMTATRENSAKWHTASNAAKEATDCKVKIKIVVHLENKLNVLCLVNLQLIGSSHYLAVILISKHIDFVKVLFVIPAKCSSYSTCSNSATTNAIFATLCLNNFSILYISCVWFLFTETATT